MKNQYKYASILILIESDYELKYVILHSGTLKNGHYTFEMKDKIGKWFFVDEAD